MPFQEKSGWIMSVALLLGGLFYFAQVAAMSSSLGELASPTIPIVILYTIILVIVAILGHIVIAIFAPKDANARSDERERKIFDRAGHLSGYVFAVGVVLSLGLYLIAYDGNTLFYAAFGSLMFSQLTDYAFRIYFYRAAL
jgi:amino acid transporter